MSLISKAFAPDSIFGMERHTTPNVTPESTRGHSNEESVQFPVWQWMVCENSEEGSWGRIRWFLSVPSSSLPLSRVQRLRAAPSQATMHIKVERLVCRLPIVSVNFEAKRNFCAAQAFYQERQVQPKRLNDSARFSLILWSRLCNWKEALVIVKPDFDPRESLGWKTVRVLCYRQQKPNGEVIEALWLTDSPSLDLHEWPLA
jgi:hypothetical protein